MKSRLPGNAKRLALMALIAMSLSACERSLTDANLRVVKPEMTTKEVESILGPPSLIEVGTSTEKGPTEPGTDSGNPGKEPAPASIIRYVYEQKDRKVTLTFANDRLIPSGISGSFE